MVQASRYMTLERWRVLDPKGRTHFIDRDYKGFHNTDNLAWFLKAEEQPFVISGVLDKISVEPEMGEWSGWVWLRL